MIAAVNDVEFDGRTISVDKASERTFGGVGGSAASVTERVYPEPRGVRAKVMDIPEAKPAAEGVSVPALPLRLRQRIQLINNICSDRAELRWKSWRCEKPFGEPWTAVRNRCQETPFVTPQLDRH